MSLSQNSHLTATFPNRSKLSHPFDEGIWMMLGELHFRWSKFNQTDRLILPNILWYNHLKWNWSINSLLKRFCDCCELIGVENIGVTNANETSNEYSRLTCKPYRVCAISVIEHVLDFNSTSSIELIPVYMVIKWVQTFKSGQFPRVIKIANKNISMDFWPKE